MRLDTREQHSTAGRGLDIVLKNFTLSKSNPTPINFKSEQSSPVSRDYKFQLFLSLSLSPTIPSTTFFPYIASMLRLAKVLVQPRQTVAFPRAYANRSPRNSLRSVKRSYPLDAAFLRGVAKKVDAATGWVDMPATEKHVLEPPTKLKVSRVDPQVETKLQKEVRLAERRVKDRATRATKKEARELLGSQSKVQNWLDRQHLQIDSVCSAGRSYRVEISLSAKLSACDISTPTQDTIEEELAAKEDKENLVEALRRFLSQRTLRQVSSPLHILPSKSH